MMKKRKIQKSKLEIWIICVAGLILLVYASYMFVMQIDDYRSSASLYENTAEKYVSSKHEENIEENIEEDIEENIEENILTWKDFIDVDISELCEENEDVVGWIYFENEDISYPVLHSGDNFTYLRRAYTGETMNAGSIFIEGRNSKDFSDAHTIIYGHNMKNLTMFGRLRYYATDQDYINGHEYFQIVTEKEKYRYKIFSCKVVAADSDVYTVYSKGKPDFLDFVNSVLISGNYLVSKESISDNDHLITLSTCQNDDRLVVTAIRCDEYRYK